MTLLPLAMIGLAVELGVVLLWSPRLQIQRVSLDGNHVARAEDLMDRINVPCGTPIVKLSARDLAAKLRAEPSVASAVVETRWPDALAIHVTEREAAWNVKTDSGWMQADATGVVFKTVAEPSAHLPLLSFPGSGLSSGSIVPAATLASVRECLKWGKDQKNFRISQIEIDRDGKFSLQSPEGTEIRLGSPFKLGEKLWIMTRLAQEIQELPGGKSIEYVNLYNWKAPAVRFRDLADLSG